MSSWSGPRPPPPRGERSRSPSRGSFGRSGYPDPFPPEYYHRERDSYDRERGWSGHDRDWQGYDYGRRGRSRSPQYDDRKKLLLSLLSPLTETCDAVGRKRRRSMSPYDRERYEPRPRHGDAIGDKIGEDLF